MLLICAAIQIYLFLTGTIQLSIAVFRKWWKNFLTHVVDEPGGMDIFGAQGQRHSDALNDFIHWVQISDVKILFKFHLLHNDIDQLLSPLYSL